MALERHGGLGRVCMDGEGCETDIPDQGYAAERYPGERELQGIRTGRWHGIPGFWSLLPNPMFGKKILFGLLQLFGLLLMLPSKAVVSICRIRMWHLVTTNLIARSLDDEHQPLVHLQG